MTWLSYRQKFLLPTPFIISSGAQFQAVEELSDLSYLRKEVGLCFFYKTYRNFKRKGIIAFLFSVCLSAVIIFIYIYWNMVILVKRCTSVLNLRCFEALLGFTIRIDLAVKMLNWHFLLTWTKFCLLCVTIFTNHLLSVNAISVNLNFLFKNSD